MDFISKQVAQNETACWDAKKEICCMGIDFELAGSVILTGLAVVFLALIGLIFIVWIVGKIVSGTVGSQEGGAKPDSSSKPAAPAAPASRPAPTPPQLVVEDGIGEEVVAVISAAVAAMMGAQGQPGGYVLTSVKRQRSSRPVWGTAGVMQNTLPF